MHGCSSFFFAHNILVFLFSRTYTLLSASFYIRCMCQHLSSDKNHQDTDERTLQWKSWSWLTSQVKVLVLGVKLWELSCWEVQSLMILMRQKHSGSVTDWTSLPAWYHLQGICFVDLPFTLARFWEWHRWSCRCCWPRKTNLLFGRAGSWKHRLFWLRTRTSVIRVVSCVACSYHVTIMLMRCGPRKCLRTQISGTSLHDMQARSALAPWGESTKAQSV